MLTREDVDKMAARSVPLPDDGETDCSPLIQADIDRQSLCREVRWLWAERGALYDIAFKHGRDYQAMGTLEAMQSVDKYDALREAALAEEKP